MEQDINNLQINYPNDELALKRKIDLLNNEWYNFINDNCNNHDLSRLYVPDGFYPYYTHQKVRMLFLGRESLDMSGANYIETMFKAIKAKVIGGKHINKHQFHRLMLCITHGLQQNCMEYKDIPYASEISDSFATPLGISFAFMNLSKFSNDSSNWNRDDKLIDEFLKISSKSNKNYFAEEINLLNPDLIISMNLNEDEKKDRHKFLGTLKNPSYYGNNKQVCAQILMTQYGEYKFLDCFHFSAPTKKDEIDFYLPIVEAINLL